MAVERLGIGHLAREAGFGSRIWSEMGYWGGRLYNLIIAAGITTILVLSLYQHVALSILLGVVLVYIVYLHHTRL